MKFIKVEKYSFYKLEEKYNFDCHSHQTVCNYMLVKEYRELFLQILYQNKN